MLFMHPTVIKSTRTALIAVAAACGLLGPSVAKAVADATPPTVTIDACSWDRPGHNPFMGDVVAAVDRYRDIPPDVRARLKARMAKREYDDLVSIRRDTITGRDKYGATISDMHFGTHQVCRSVSRAAWGPDTHERGLVYCDSGQCILVPTVCRNVSRIARAAVAHERAEGPDESDAVPAAAPPRQGPILPRSDAIPTALALDGSPSFASPLDWRSPAGAGAPSGSFPMGGGAGAPGQPSSAVLTASASAVPLASDSQLPIALAPVPEPQTWLLLLGGLAGLAARNRRCPGTP